MKNVCRNCGSEYVVEKDGKLFCQSCGATFEAKPKVAVDTPTSDVSKFEKMFKQVVSITSIVNDQIKVGTAFFISSKYALTNAHVLVENDEEAVSIMGKNYENTKSFEFELIAYDAQLDVALIETTNVSSFNFCVLSETVNNGEQVYALGNSKGEGLCVVNGLVSDKNRMVNGIQHIMCSALVTNGNSGGPLYNERGFVIGMISMSTPDVAMMNYALPASAINQFLAKIKESKGIQIN